MNNVFSALLGIINFMPPWIMLGVFGAIILLIILILALKGFKRVFFRVLIYIFIGAMVVSYVGYLLAQAVQAGITGGVEAQLQLIDFAIGWGPTVLFAVGVLIKVLRGLRRGLRKSLILALHATCAGAVSVIFFLIVIYVKETDAAAVSVFNWLAGENALQNLLGVPASCSTLKEVLAAYIPTLAGAGFEGLSPYIYTIVDFVYRLIFALIACLVFFSIDFTLYIVYVLCYSQHKYKVYRKLEFKHGMTDKNYKKHPLGGGAVGLVRGVAAGLLAISFVGSTFYVVAGGKGEGKLEDHDFGDAGVNYYYQIYRSVESYGAQGIFKILNAISDASDTPFYLFAADLVFSGELNDEELGVSENIKFREEFGTLIGFSQDVLNLLIKYGPEEINAIVNGEITDNAFDTVVEVMTRAGFKEDFDSIIDAFNDQTYFINLSMALVNTVVSNIDEISFTKDAIGESEKDIIKLVFKKGYLSENIPADVALMQATGKTEAEGDDIRPYITVKHLFNKSDVKLVLNVVLSLLSGEETGDTLTLVKRLVPEVAKLSILSTERKADINPVIGRLYTLVENVYLSDGNLEEGISTYAYVNDDNIDWVGEIQNLLGVVDDVLLLYENLSSAQTEGADALAIVKTLFNKEDEKYEPNMEAYDNICSVLTHSQILGKALSTTYVYNTIKGALDSLSMGIEFPDEVVYIDTVGEDGEPVHGELYQILRSVKLIFGENAKALDELLGAADGMEIDKMLQAAADILATEDEDEKTVKDYVTESLLLRSVISGALIYACEQGNTFYIPDAALETKDGEPVNVITKEELFALLDNVDELVGFVMPFVDSEGDWQEAINEFLTKDGDFYKLVKSSRIFEGTVARLVNDKLGGTDVIVIPPALYISSENLENINGWITVNGKQGELLNLLDALLDSGFAVMDIFDSNEGEGLNATSVVNKILGMGEDQLESFLSSSILHYTVSKYITEGAKLGEFTLVIPRSARLPSDVEGVNYLIKKSELVSAVGEISALGLGDGKLSVEDILVKIAKNKSVLTSGKIIPASMVATIVQLQSFADFIPDGYGVENWGMTDKLENYGADNPWTKELPALIDALDELLGLQKAGDDFTFNGNFSDQISSILINANSPADIDEGADNPRTKLGVLCDSVTFRNKITKEVDNVLTPNLIDTDIRDSIKYEGNYTYNELQKLCNAINALDITSFDADAFTLDAVKEKLTVDSLSTLYASAIVKGIITKSVEEVIAASDVICTHPLAYENSLKVFKECEIESMLGVFGSGINGGNMNLSKVSEYLYKDGVTKSYILVASITAQIIDHPGIIIPDSVMVTVGREQYVDAEELSLAVNAFLAYDSGLESLENITEDTAITIPDKSVREDIFKSEIIRARITYQLVQMSGSAGVLAVSLGEYKVVTDIRATDDWNVGETAVMSADQLVALANALEILSEGGVVEFDAPVIDNIEQILSHKDDLEELLKSDVVRYRICKFLADEGEKYKKYGVNIGIGTEEAFDLVELKSVEVAAGSPEQIIAAAEKIEEASSIFN